MPHAVKLHTRPERVYRGKYPTRYNHFSNGGAETAIVAKHLDIRSPHFVELNNGDRYYIDGFFLSTFNLPHLSSDLRRFDWAPVVANATNLDVHAYHRMLADINAMRAARDAARKANPRPKGKL